jgi:aminoglycoside 2''-phosphotransferase
MTGNVKMTPKAQLPPPDAVQLREALRRARPDLDGAAIALLGEGWAFEAYIAGDRVLRFPKRAEYVETVDAEAALLRELATTLPLEVPLIHVHADGPSGLPFTSHRLVPGVTSTTMGPAAAETMGRFLRALQSFPPQRARELGIKSTDSAEWRSKTAANYETVIRRVFPLVSCEARVMIKETFESYLNDDANFDFEPLLQHGDINPRNVLTDPITGELSGVIDFGNVYLGDPALDFADLLEGDFARLGTLNQLAALERGYGRPLAPLASRCSFYAFCWPLNHITEGLEANDREFVADGIRMVNAKLPFGVRCDSAAAKGSARPPRSPRAAPAPPAPARRRECWPAGWCPADTSSAGRR